MTKRSFGNLEQDILHILQSGERTTVKKVHQLLGGQDKYTTVMTVMSRLAEKKLLDRERVGLHYDYWLIPSKIKSPSFLKQLKEKILSVKTATMVSYLIEEADDITDDELLDIEEMIQKAKRKRELHDK